LLGLCGVEKVKKYDRPSYNVFTLKEGFLFKKVYRNNKKQKEETRMLNCIKYSNIIKKEESRMIINEGGFLVQTNLDLAYTLHTT